MSSRPKRRGIVQHLIPPCSTAPLGTAPLRRDAAPHGIAQHCAPQHSTARHRTAVRRAQQHCPARRSPASTSRCAARHRPAPRPQHSTARHRASHRGIQQPANHCAAYLHFLTQHRRCCRHLHRSSTGPCLLAFGGHLHTYKSVRFRAYDDARRLARCMHVCTCVLH